MLIQASELIREAPTWTPFMRRGSIENAYQLLRERLIESIRTNPFSLIKLGFARKDGLLLHGFFVYFPSENIDNKTNPEDKADRAFELLLKGNLFRRLKENPGDPIYLSYTLFFP